MESVKDFYRETPFNYNEEVDFYYNSIIESNQVLEYLDLHRLLRKRKFTTLKPVLNSIIEFGCGTGWLSNSIAYYYQKRLLSIDFTKKAVDIAAQVSSKLSVDVEYKVEDIFKYSNDQKYDLVVSMGVLHHTSDCKKAFQIISRFVKPGGFLYVGLYHSYGRKPMLKMLQNYSHWHGIDSAFNLFKKMNLNMKNTQHINSWFRDQVLHPHETQHSLTEVKSWIDELNFNLVSTSINNYKPIKTTSSRDFLQLEYDLEAYSYKKNIQELKFTPGYFTVCAQKKS